MKRKPGGPSALNYSTALHVQRQRAPPCWAPLHPSIRPPLTGCTARWRAEGGSLSRFCKYDCSHDISKTTASCGCSCEAASADSQRRGDAPLYSCRATYCITSAVVCAVLYDTEHQWKRPAECCFSGFVPRTNLRTSPNLF